MPGSHCQFQPTTLERELEEQRLWVLRPQFAKATIFDILLQNEFLPQQDIFRNQLFQVKRLLAFSRSHVPFYRHLFREAGLTLEDFNSLDDLRKIPVLTKSMVQENKQDLLPDRLPRGETLAGETKTSGSTGHPLQIPVTHNINGMFGCLKQREYRWFRWNPKRVLAGLRPGEDLPPGANGTRLELGETCCLSSWQRLGPFFETGPFLGFLRANPVEDQIRWLAEKRPAYLVAQAADMELLALGHQETLVPKSLDSILVISQDLPGEMEQLITRHLNVPLYTNYGLNEIGLVATRCREGQRYHVHSEHCVVEIVDEEGQPCQPGECGKILVTGLNNPAMPLVRYDTDDLAEAVEGPCPCGRSLPSFGRIHGRYRRLTSLPPGTMAYYRAISLALSDMDEKLSAPLRQYQVHQDHDGNFTLCVVAASPLPEAFRAFILDHWRQVVFEKPFTLDVRQVDDIPRPPGGKHQNFTSDFMPNPWQQGR